MSVIAMAFSTHAFAYENILVLLDNTFSMNKRGDSFRHSICKIGDPKSTLGNTFYFAPIGKPSAKWKVIENSKRSFSSNIKKLFTFEDRFTDIDSSFQWIEQSDCFVQKKINKILIISDMEPDVRNTGKKPWVYDRSDLENMRNYLIRLKRWSRTIEVEIVLYGWRNDYNQSLTAKEIERTYIDNEWNQIEREIQRRSLCKHCEKPIRSLLKKELDLIALVNPLFTVDTISEDESPLNILCKKLPNNICSKQLKDSLSIRVDIDPKLQISLDGSVMLTMPRFVRRRGPQRTIRLIDNTIHYGIQPEHDRKADYHFRIMSSDKGRTFSYPYLLVTVQKDQEMIVQNDPNIKKIVETKTDKNGSEMLKKPKKSRASKKDVLFWLGNEMKNVLEEYSIDDFPIQKDNITIKIKNFDNSPINKGYRFHVKTKYDAGDFEPSNTTEQTDDEGIVSMQVPLQGKSTLYMVYTKKNFTTKKEEDIYIEIEKLENHILKTDKVFTVTLPPELYTMLNQSFDFNDSKPVGINLKIFLDDGELFLIKSEDCETSDVNEFYLLPGQYIFEAIPGEDPDYLSDFPQKRIDYKHNKEMLKEPFSTRILKDIHKDKWYKQCINSNGIVQSFSEVFRISQSSAYFLKGLLEFISSDDYTENTKKQLIKNLKDKYYFSDEDQTMLERRIQRAMIKIQLIKKTNSGLQVIPDAYMMLQVLYDRYLSNGKSNSDEILVSQGSKNFYNEWITYTLKAHHMINEKLEAILLIK